MADPFRAFRQLERLFLMAKPQSGKVTDGAKLIGTMVFDRQAGTVEFRPAPEEPQPKEPGGDGPRGTGAASA